MANSNLGTHVMGINGNFLPNSQAKPFNPVYNVSFYSRPMLGITFNCVLGKKICVFDTRKSNQREISSALANGDAKPRLTELSSIEKELKFSPTFSDYVKIMESVKLDRSKKFERDSEEQNPNNRARGKLTSLDSTVKGNKKVISSNKQSIKIKDLYSKERESKNFKDFTQSVKKRESSNGGWGLVENILENRNTEQRTGANPKGKIENLEKKFEWKNERENYSYSKINVTQIENSVNKRREKRKTNRFGVSNKQKSELESQFGCSNSSKEKNAETKYDKVSKRDWDRADFDERSAFKTFEVFTDMRNQPRVLRMELEERIQKLASRLNATDVNMPEWQFSRMMHGAKIKFSDHTILRVVQILGRYGNWRRALQVVQWLQSRDRFKSYKSRYIYTTVLDVLGKAKRPFEALNIFYSMREELSSYPDLAAYHCIAVTLGQAGLIKELFDVIDCMQSNPNKKFNLGPLRKWDPRLEPDLVVYHSVLNACVQQKQWEGAFWVLQQLKQQNIRPTNTTYGLVMEVMLVCGKYNLVYEFFKKVEKSYIPSALNYKVLINALWREGKTKDAVKAVREMERRGVVGSAALYYDLARCLCSAGLCQDALLQVDKICKVAKKPLVVTYTGLIQSCLDTGNIQNAKYIFDHMHEYCAPNTITCNIMLKSYINHKMFHEAKGLFRNIVRGLEGVSEKSDLKGRAIPDKFTFNTMMEGCVANGEWDEFEHAFRCMLRNGLHFDSKRHLRLVLDAFRAGKEQVLELAWEHLLSYHRVPPVPLIMERISLKLREGNVAPAVSCVTNFDESEISNISANSWFNLLSNNSNCLKEETIVKFIREIRVYSESGNESNPVYSNILSGCKQFLSSVSADLEPITL